MAYTTSGDDEHHRADRGHLGSASGYRRTAPRLPPGLRASAVGEQGEELTEAWQGVDEFAEDADDEACGFLDDVFDAGIDRERNNNWRGREQGQLYRR